MKQISAEIMEFGGNGAFTRIHAKPKTKTKN